MWEVLRDIGLILGLISVILGFFYRGTLLELWGDYVAPRRSRLDFQTIALVNEHFHSKVKVFGVLQELPVLEDNGPMYLPDELQRQAKAVRRSLELNNPHAVLIHSPEWRDNPIHFRYQHLDYAGLKVLRQSKEAGAQPEVLSTCVLPICDEFREVYLHRRSEKSDTARGTLHTFGGGFMPAGGRTAARFDRDLVSCAQREFQEEANLTFSWNNQPMIAAKELDSGFVHVAFLGVNLDATEVKRRQNNWEGKIVAIKYGDLLSHLRNPEANWCPSGKAHVLLWLAMGAPGSRRSHWLLQQSPRKIFRLAMNL